MKSAEPSKGWFFYQKYQKRVEKGPHILRVMFPVISPLTINLGGGGGGLEFFLSRRFVSFDRSGNLKWQEITTQRRVMNYDGSACVGACTVSTYCTYTRWSVAGVRNEPYSQLTPLSEVAIQARQSTRLELEPCPSFVAWRTGMDTPLSWLSWVGFV